MNSDNCDIACQLVSKSYVAQGSQALARRQRKIKTLLSERKIPAEGWDDVTIETFVQDLALMDSNNFLDNVGVGEREGRVACDLVSRRYLRLAHGIGRSGDISAEQPKAAGSSVIAKLANLLAGHALDIAGIKDLGIVTVLPLATGMAITMTLLALKAQRPPQARYVLWSRIDQKTCLKAIASANLIPIVIENIFEGDELRTDLLAVENKIKELGSDNIVCVATTTSCFAPRGTDKIVDVATLCLASGVPHIINNAYGVQAAQICREVTRALRKGRVDAIIQSTDKNFMVPVGGSVVASPKANMDLVQAVNKSYPGRAAVSSHLDLLMTLLHWGVSGWKKVLEERATVYEYMKSSLEGFAEEMGERVLSTPNNPISLGLTLSTLKTEAREGQTASKDVTYFGSMLWSRCVSGTRVVARGKRQSVAGVEFDGYGAHHDTYPCDYMTAAASLGTARSDVDEFVSRLSKCFKEWRKQKGVVLGEDLVDHAADPRVET
ncbi:hypothetical protein BSKO_08646 [Bryopsis sp. KO-2023]|nr:hypothetical protein BSKO_08646 [Bryopsis sp. KO-2023]